MYRLVVQLSFGITGLWYQAFDTEVDARKKAGELPYGFKVIKDSYVDYDLDVIVLPFDKELEDK